MSEPASALTSVTAAPTSAEVPVQRWKRGELTQTTDHVTEEVPVALVYHGVPHVVMLASPADLEDYAVGFTVSEGLVGDPREIQSVEVVRGAESIEVRIGIAGERFSELLRRRRNLTGRSGCGLCGAETVEEAIRPPVKVADGVRVSAADLHAALIQLESLQPINAQTGSIHAAAWVVPGQGIQLVREDVGRHNALDKVIGALVRSGTDVTAGYAVITSRASFEMVQKAAAAGITFMVAVSAPTALAIRMAEQTGLTLVGFARRDQHVVYAHPERLV
ncbi:MAG TPA: formate dehydrogenase accessory sulfurtransferase FdhD [Steroidobacteraceae bacterium]|jgi:FdhD protein|nr:formate dehydrogenase accessory sulfurtransferase FdhD [Steroidobacteraceae bacterium]